MAEFQQQPPQSHHPNYERPTTDPFKTILPQTTLSTSKLLALLTLLPIGAFLLFLAGISFIGTVIGLAITSPLFLIFSPILLPAAFVIAVAVAGFLTSGAFGVTALSSVSWMANYLRKSRVPFQLDQAKQWVREAAAQAAQTAEEASQAIQTKAQDWVKTDEDGPAQEEGSSEEVGPAQTKGSSEEVGPAQEKGSTTKVDPAQEKGRTEDDSPAQQQGTAKEEAAQEPGKAQESGKAQGKGKAQGGKARGGGKT
ncbi:oleosin 16.4 kDa-like isoform X4 [Cucurbita moschata]|uniref:Oleosin 16.4 kDa-like isoform X3 n=1 Tax=Cucurbita moschata TaxID=3662 RepID=A0A6J1EBC5_CUCMO|nr:oleosin 16.4 kDa-like isoform X3 [Cucurbita moschata]XP_022924078.1 oleosin 16.4 kDa-like isoform X4 [Cucurbita moschata]